MIGLISLLFAISFDTLSYNEMSCDDANALIDRVYDSQKRSDYITLDNANEIVEVIKESVPECFNERSK